MVKQKMKINCALTAVNEYDKYTRFVPIFIESWKALYPNIQPVIVYVGKEIPDRYQQYKENIILFEPTEHMNTVAVSQIIRLLYPALLGAETTTVITDIDMLPGRSDYFNSVNEVADDAFLSLRSITAAGHVQLAMCYVAAHTFTWKSIFSINNLADIYEYFNQLNMTHDKRHGGVGWHTDQLILHKSVTNWSKCDERWVCMVDKAMNFSRLDISPHKYKIDAFVDMFKKGTYSDAHMYADQCPWNSNQIKYIIDQLFTQH